MMAIRNDLRVLTAVGFSVLMIVLSLLVTGCWDDTGKTESRVEPTKGSVQGVSSRGLESGMGGPPVEAPKEPQPVTDLPESKDLGTDGSSPGQSESGSEGTGVAPAEPTTATTPSEPTTGL